MGLRPLVCFAKSRYTAVLEYLLYARGGGKDKPGTEKEGRLEFRPKVLRFHAAETVESKVSRRTRFLIKLQFGVLFIVLGAALAQQEPVTADQVISGYLEAIGANRMSTVDTFVETGEINETTSWQPNRSSQSPSMQGGVFESYFKSPNLRFHTSITGQNQVIAMYGCDGKIAWYIDSHLKRTESTPKPGGQSECDEGFQQPVSRLREPKAKIRLLKQKEVEGRMAWEIRVDVPKSPATETYYFDAETFLLLRFQRLGLIVTYSDYRDLGGIKLPFRLVQEFTNSKVVTSVREVRINVPIDDARFVEPEIRDGKIAVNPVPKAKSGPNLPPASAEATKLSGAETSGTRGADSIVELNFPNFAQCTIQELEMTVPELKGLKPSADQEKLPALLEKVGAKTVDIMRNTPNLISQEIVVGSPQEVGATKHEYDYLILPHVDGTMVRLDEFRLDLKSGEKFEADEAITTESSLRSNLERANNEVAMSKGYRPLTQGFAISWVSFYPSNLKRTTYRYLGEQKRDGNRTVVLAFAQKPALVLVPAVFRYRDKTAPMFLQGIAWVDHSDFRILRLRTDLLSPVPEVSLQRLTADIQFGLTRVEQVASLLPLPREVTITAVVGGSTMRENHEYSKYRLFRAQSKVVALP